LAREAVPEIADHAGPEQTRVSNGQSAASVIGFPVRILAVQLRQAADVIVLDIVAYE